MQLGQTRVLLPEYFRQCVYVCANSCSRATVTRGGRQGQRGLTRQVISHSSLILQGLLVKLAGQDLLCTYRGGSSPEFT